MLDQTWKLARPRSPRAVAGLGDGPERTAESQAAPVASWPRRAATKTVRPLIRAAQRSALPTWPGQRTISGVKLATRQNDRFCAAQTTRLCPYRAVPNNLADQARSAPCHVPQERRDYRRSPVVPRIGRRWSSTDSFQGCVRFWEPLRREVARCEWLREGGSADAGHVALVSAGDLSPP